MRKINYVVAIFLISVSILFSLSIYGLVSYFTKKDDDMMVVLTFHRVVKDNVKNQYYKNNQWVHSETMFEKQMSFLADNGYRTLSLDEYYDWYTGKTNYNTSKTCVITIDDGDIENYYIVLPILKKYNLKATLFVIASEIEKDAVWNEGQTQQVHISEKQINLIKTEYPNFDIQSHTFNMHHMSNNNKPVVYSMTKEQIIDDFKQMEKYDMKYMAYPFGASNELVRNTANDFNYKLAFSFAGPYIPSTRKNNPMKINRIKINGHCSLFKFKMLLKIWY